MTTPEIIATVVAIAVCLPVLGVCFYFIDQESKWGK